MRNIFITLTVSASLLFAQGTPQGDTAQSTPSAASAQDSAKSASPAVMQAVRANPYSSLAHRNTAVPQQESIRGKASTPKERRHKISYAAYDSTLRATRDSIAAITYHHLITFSGGRTHDKRLGDLDENSKWGGTSALYYSYRYYINPHIAAQGRLGGTFRYARFSKEQNTSRTLSYEGSEYDLSIHKSIASKNFSMDLPATIKFGGHLAPTKFLYAGITVGITKSIYESIVTDGSLQVEDPSKELKNDLKILETNGYDVGSYRRTSKGGFNYDDWETNSWIGVGLDTKYLGLEFQALIMGASTKDNHRYHPIFHGDFPTWRLMVDFSLK